MRVNTLGWFHFTRAPRRMKILDNWAQKFNPSGWIFCEREARNFGGSPEFYAWWFKTFVPLRRVRCNIFWKLQARVRLISQATKGSAHPKKNKMQPHHTLKNGPKKKASSQNELIWRSKSFHFSSSNNFSVRSFHKPPSSQHYGLFRNRTLVPLKTLA